MNDDNALVRFEFIEVLVRIAKGRYIETGEETQIALALEKLLQEKILPF